MPSAHRILSPGLHTLQSMSAIHVLVLEPDTEPRIETIEHDALSSLQRLVGGYLEAVHGEVGAERITLYCNEDGRIAGLRPNDVATLLWRWSNPAVQVGNDLLGTVVVTGVDGCDEASAPHRAVVAAERLYAALAEAACSP